MLFWVFILNWFSGLFFIMKYLIDLLKFRFFCVCIVSSVVFVLKVLGIILLYLDFRNFGGMLDKGWMVIEIFIVVCLLGVFWLVVLIENLYFLWVIDFNFCLSVMIFLVGWILKMLLVSMYCILVFLFLFRLCVLIVSIVVFMLVLLGKVI